MWKKKIRCTCVSVNIISNTNFPSSSKLPRFSTQQIFFVCLVWLCSVLRWMFIEPRTTERNKRQAGEGIAAENVKSCRELARLSDVRGDYKRIRSTTCGSLVRAASRRGRGGIKQCGFLWGKWYQVQLRKRTQNDSTKIRCLPTIPFSTLWTRRINHPTGLWMKPADQEKEAEQENLK